MSTGSYLYRYIHSNAYLYDSNLYHACMHPPPNAGVVRMAIIVTPCASHVTAHFVFT